MSIFRLFRKYNKFSLILTLILIISLVAGCGEIASDKYFGVDSTKETVIAEGDLPEKLTKDSSGDSSSAANLPDGTLKVHIIDIGQGLGVLFEFTEDSGTKHFALYDGGDSAHATVLLNYLSSQGVDKFEYMIVSHFDADHVCGPNVAYPVYGLNSVVYEPDYRVNTMAFRSWANVTTAASLLGNVKHPSCGDKVYLGGAEITFLSPDKPSDYYEDENNLCIGVLVKYKDSTFFCLGDGEKEEEYDLVERCNQLGIGLKSNYYIVGHHGSSSSSTEMLMKAITPEGEHTALISCGKDNDYGHPHDVVVNRLTSMGYNIRRTDTEGSIVIEVK